ncbi:MAG TPA: hypothetical protein DGX96_05390 [Lachnospiraceae bacterium]|jgi:replicative DNA helicase|nr:hypothetical protein [Lachnospiraceae bacterium]
MEKVKRLSPETEGYTSYGTGTAGVKSIPTGFQTLDEHTSGWQPGEVIAICGDSGIGKTTLLTSLVKQIAVDRGIPTLFFAIECGTKQVVDRLLANYCSIGYQWLVRYRVPQEQFEEFNKSLVKLKAAPLFIEETSFTIDDIQDQIIYAVKHYGIRIVFIDYIQLILTNPDAKEIVTPPELMRLLVQGFKRMAKYYKITIVFSSQQDTGTAGLQEELSGEHKDQFVDIPDDGTILDDVDEAFLLLRPDYYGINTDLMGNDLRKKAFLKSAKMRSCPPLSIRLNYEPEYARFSEDDPLG